MQLDSEKQRELLLNCLGNTQISGLVADLLPALADVSLLIEAVKTAPIVAPNSD